jgi:hypothetical protein
VAENPAGCRVAEYVVESNFYCRVARAISQSTSIRSGRGLAIAGTNVAGSVSRLNMRLGKSCPASRSSGERREVETHGRGDGEGPALLAASKPALMPGRSAPLMHAGHRPDQFSQALTRGINIARPCRCYFINPQYSPARIDDRAWDI